VHTSVCDMCTLLLFRCGAKRAAGRVLVDLLRTSARTLDHGLRGAAACSSFKKKATYRRSVRRQVLGGYYVGRGGRSNNGRPRRRTGGRRPCDSARENLKQGAGDVAGEVAVGETDGSEGKVKEGDGASVTIAAAWFPGNGAGLVLRDGRRPGRTVISQLEPSSVAVRPGTRHRRDRTRPHAHRRALGTSSR